MSPVFTLTAQFSPKCPCRELIALFSPQNAQISSKSLQHKEFPQKPCFHPFCTLIFLKKPKVYPKDLISTSSHFGTFIFCFTLTAQFSPVSFSLHSFSRKAPVSSQNAQFCSKFLRHNDFSQKPCFYVSCNPLRFCSYGANA